MLEEYGDKYINLREYMSTDAMKNAGSNSYPVRHKRYGGRKRPAVASFDDMLHFNSDGYEIIGKLVYDRMEQLRLF